MKSITYDTLEVRVHPDRETLGADAASLVAEAIRTACATRGEARVTFACAPSQNEFLSTLVRKPIAWGKVVVFHMDEYVGLRAERRQSFRHYLHHHLLAHIDEPKGVHFIQGEKDPLHECARYGKLLSEKPIDVVCLGIGENGHLAFNDPSTANFNDPEIVKVVELDEACRRQQVNDGCFPGIDAVPSHALTVALPALVSARQVSCIATGERKARAVRDTLLGPVGENRPASILRRHAHAVLHLDPASSTLLKL